MRNGQGYKLLYCSGTRSRVLGATFGLGVETTPGHDVSLRCRKAPTLPSHAAHATSLSKACGNQSHAPSPPANIELHPLERPEDATSGLPPQTPGVKGSRRANAVQGDPSGRPFPASVPKQNRA